jgi:DNA-binding NtrC family response regulator
MMHTVLLVDDEPVIREGCRRAFSAAGYRALTAANGQEALDLLASEPIQAILCDLKMPVMGAVKVLEEVVASYPHVPVIIITGHGTVASAVECIKNGAYDFITKPFRIDHLILVVQRAIDNLPPLQRFEKLPF